MQVIDRKGWKASYPKVVMGTPYQDSMFTGGAGAELQKVMNLSPCLGSDRERQSLQLDGTPGACCFHVYLLFPAFGCERQKKMNMHCRFSFVSVCVSGFRIFRVHACA